MKIVVCIKQVPDTVEVKIDPKTGTLIRDGVPSIINHDDKTGIEAALQLKEQLGGTVTVVSMGPPQADVALREALAMGCDEAYLVSAREFGGSDTYATSGIIAAALKKIGYDRSSQVVRLSTVTQLRLVHRLLKNCTCLRFPTLKKLLKQQLTT